MADSEKKKDFWDILVSITPLILGFAVTGVGAFFTQIYNYRQLQLNQIMALGRGRRGDVHSFMRFFHSLR